MGGGAVFDLTLMREQHVGDLERQVLREVRYLRNVTGDQLITQDYVALEPAFRGVTEPPTAPG